MEDSQHGQELRTALARLVGRGAEATWLPEVRPLFDLPAVRAKARELGSERADEALRSVLKDAVAELDAPHYQALLTIVLALDPAYEGMIARERRRIAGAQFRGGKQPVTHGTIRQHHEPRALAQLVAVLLRTAATDMNTRTTDAVASGRPVSAESFVWHPSVHSQWANERLCFWRLTVPFYTRNDALTRLSEVMDRCGVHSWSVDELIGDANVLVRAWLSAEYQEFEQMLFEVFGRNPGMTVERFVVTEIITDWPWAHPGEAMRTPDRATLAQSASVMTYPDAPDRRAEMVERGLLSPVYHQRGMKFAVVVRPSLYPTSYSTGSSLVEAILRLLDDAKEFVTEISLFRGSGFGDYLLRGRMAPQHFYQLEMLLLSPLRELVNTVGSDISAMVMSTPQPIMHIEAIPAKISTDTAPPSVEDLLRRGEDRQLEVKGWAFSDLAHWLKDEHTPPRRSDNAIEHLRRGIVALLNSEGGNVVIGAVDSRNPRHQSRLLDGPQVGDYTVCGIDDEMTDGWDVYEHKLRQACSAGIEPSPATLILSSRVNVAGRTVCVLTVQPSRQTWFYTQSRRDRVYRFYVRDGGSTVELSGPQLDNYKRQFARPG
ncbi:MAG TPA: ATP-binding protein [Microbacteriaceae bacterium]|jgi:hypothetical protein|nr:ATP-binding protein [Microbacteriaceae bacterium]